jgi:hypothetical protein
MNQHYVPKLLLIIGTLQTEITNKFGFSISVLYNRSRQRLRMSLGPIKRGAHIHRALPRDRNPVFEAACTVAYAGYGRDEYPGGALKIITFVSLRSLPLSSHQNVMSPNPAHTQRTGALKNA